MDFSNLVTLPRIKKWIDDNKENFKLINNNIVGYKLNIHRPFWFTEPYKCDEIESLVFTGKSNEEILFKMYEECLNTLVWKGGKQNGKSVDLLNYLISCNEIFNDMIYKVGKEYAVQYIEPEDDNSDDDSCGKYTDSEEDNDEENSIIIKDSNKEKYERILIKGLFRDRLEFYGFSDCGMYDCCFSVEKLKAV